MMLRLFIDTETTGLYDFDAPAGDRKQPHLAALCAVLADMSAGRVLAQLDTLVQPDGWTMPEEVTAINGLTTERLVREGRPLSWVMGVLYSLLPGRYQIAGHHLDFDLSVLYTAAIRACYGVRISGEFFAAGRLDTTLMGRSVFPELPLSSHGKGPRLSALHERIFGYPHPGGHTAEGDVAAVMAILPVLEAISGYNRGASVSPAAPGQAVSPITLAGSETESPTPLSTLP